MAARKIPVAKGVQPKVVPKFGEVGFKFPVMAEITDVDYSEDYPYYVEVTLENKEDNYNNTCAVWVGVSYLQRMISEVDPKQRKVFKQQELKEAQALVDKLTKELASL